MDNLLFWVVIGLLGFVLYISPGFFIHRMYESFVATGAGAAAAVGAAGAAAAQPPAVKEVDATGATAATLAASQPPNPSNPSENQIKNLLEILNTPGMSGAPDMPVQSPTAQKAEPRAEGASQIPIEHETMRSRPEPARSIPGPSMALKHGDLFKTTLPRNPQPGTNGMLGSMGTQARAPAERVVYIERERESCERPAVNPNCPDMRDYIRKDSIPCWGCKLR
jgi:hypothetical protein